MHQLKMFSAKSEGAEKWKSETENKQKENEELVSIFVFFFAFSFISSYRFAVYVTRQRSGAQL